jgi:hypothetical protein
VRLPESNCRTRSSVSDNRSSRSSKSDRPWPSTIGQTMMRSSSSRPVSRRLAVRWELPKMSRSVASEALSVGTCFTPDRQSGPLRSHTASAPLPRRALQSDPYATRRRRAYQLRKAGARALTRWKRPAHSPGEACIFMSTHGSTVPARLQSDRPSRIRVRLAKGASSSMSRAQLHASLR